MDANLTQINHSSSTYRTQHKVAIKTKALEEEIEILASRFVVEYGLDPAVKTRALEISRSTEKMTSVRFKRSSALAAACLNVAFKELGNPEAMTRIVRLSGCTKTEIRVISESLIKTLEIVAMSPTAINFLEKQAQILQLDESTKSVVLEKLKKAEHHIYFVGRSPHNVCAAAIFKALYIDGEGEQRTTRRVFYQTLGTNEKTIRDIVQLLEKMIHEEALPDLVRVAPF